jgi:hypothetical protein
MEDPKFELLAEQAQRRDPVPGNLSKKKDGFSRQDVVNAFQRTFEMIGGVPRMALWANANPDKFYPLYARLMPSTAIQIGDNARVQIVHAIGPTELDRHPGGPDHGLPAEPLGEVEDGGRQDVRGDAEGLTVPPVEEAGDRNLD